MIRILLIGSDFNTISNVTNILKKHHNIEIIKSLSGKEALEKIKNEPYDLVIIDEVIKDMPGLKIAKQIVTSNPFLNCTLISSLSPKEFHEATEGLGLLMQLPLSPTDNHIESLLSHLKKILNISSTNKGCGNE